MSVVVQVPSSPIPSIHISLAPPEDIPNEPYSPFNSISFPESAGNDDDDGEPFSPRSARLLPPPVGSPLARNSPTRPSPLGRGEGGKGLDAARFQSLLQSSRERTAPTSGVPDLRKQVALKAHKSKAAERRALFLSKIEQPPSPSATSVPVTPPESPAVLHYSLPSPGLESPISLFETMQLVNPVQAKKQPRRGWVEHVEFNAPQPKKMPSLDQISARAAQRNKTTRLPIGAPSVTITIHAPKPANASTRLPAFLQARTKQPQTPALPPVSPAAPARLPLPQLPPSVRRSVTPPPAPHPRFGVTTTVLPAPPAQPRSRTASGTALTAQNLDILAHRNERGKAMLEKILRRVSAPAELERPGARRGDIFGEHRVLVTPGGF
ncbi:hypothetical protein EXIGLDRAFT_691574 [Exidia glandulosa HHB12029]|uniref:Uncharacterized protein n=1 Tax=Exidia glandulosa HHB12029 TaxID=1314781 RepID=A0A165IJK5_EXIGL|nr:hypothetical protein EXIGLDRAFT_691574 [Exidia glandulosa HHB12029]